MNLIRNMSTACIAGVRHATQQFMFHGKSSYYLPCLHNHSSNKSNICSSHTKQLSNIWVYGRQVAWLIDWYFVSAYRCGVRTFGVARPQGVKKVTIWCFLWSALNKRLSKQSRRRWFLTSRSLWRHYNVPWWPTSLVHIYVTWPQRVNCARWCYSLFSFVWLTHFLLVWHIYPSVNWVSIGSNNGLSPIRRQRHCLNKCWLLSSWPLRTNLSEIWIEIQSFSFMKMHLKMSSAK